MKQKKQETDGKLRVAVYCRFNHALQEHDASFELQKMSFLQRIESTPNWELADIYADLGVSGARKEPGSEFCRMMEDCKAGKIDIVLCKSFSRFSRRVVLAIERIRELKEMGVRVIFENEGIDTAADNVKMLLTVLATVAQEEINTMPYSRGKM